MLKKYADESTHPARAHQAYSILIAAAARRETLRYGQLAEAMHFGVHEGVGRGSVLNKALGCLIHLAAHVSLQPPRVSGQDIENLVDHLAVVSLSLLAHAGGPAAVDEEVQAGSVRCVARKVIVAGANREHLSDHPEGPAHGSDVRKRAEVA